MVDRSVDPAKADDVIIDITDAALARQALYDFLVSTSPTGELVIDLRDDVLDKLVDLAPTGRSLPDTPTASGRPPDLQSGLRLATIEDGPQWDKAEHFVYDTYLALGYTDESADEQVEELKAYRSLSRFHCAVDEDDNIVGSLRVILGEYHQLPVGQFPRIDFSDEEPMCHMSSIVVDPAARSTGVIEHLYREGWADGLRWGARTITGLSEKWMLDGFRKVYCMPFVPCGLPEWYMGGEVIPIAMSTSPEAMAEVARTNPEFWWWNIETLTAEEIERHGFAALTKDALLRS
ncbi:MAG: hypothetical protein KDB04_07235 [Acidimicrobiales bacterium]|nr:hypothetical protein [Acidimicrobiales bacterium]HRW38719.1 hypothetical protein [Aquihabitans sp.]